MQLKGSKTHDNLKAAFAGESQANRRYLYFTAISNTWSRWATRRPTSRSAPPS